MSHVVMSASSRTRDTARPSAPQGTARRHTADDLRRAVDRDELRLHVQPKVDLRTGEVTGVEALVRWQHPQLGLLGPDELLAVATATSMMVPIGGWVLDEAIRLASRWRNVRAGGPLRVWVNLATEQLVDGDDLCERIRRALADGSITARSIGFEVTESTLLEDLPLAVEVLRSLRHLGFEIALDDFGTGYSSLWYLRRLPVTAVKIDRSFVAGLGGSLADEAIVAAVIDLAHALGLRVVAEGIEELHQADTLIRMGAERGQGFYFARPLSPDEIDPLLSLPWCGAEAPAPPLVGADARADALPGFGSPRARLLLTALDSAHDSIIVTSAAASVGGSLLASPIVYANPAFEAETGHCAREMIGRTVEVLLPEETHAEAGRWFAEVSAHRAPATAEWWNRRADGSMFPCEVTLSPVVDERGVHTHWLHVRRDLTQRRAAEGARARFEGLMEQSTSLVFLAESDGTWVYANSAQRRVLGLAPGDSLEGVCSEAVLTREQRRQFAVEVSGALARERRWAGETTFRDLVTGELTPAITDLQLVDDPLRPGVSLYASVSREIGELKAAEKAERRRRELNGFAADLAGRALSLGRDQILDDVETVLASFGSVLGVDLVHLDVIDRPRDVMTAQSAWADPTGRPAARETVALSRLPHWLAHLDASTALSAWRPLHEPPTPWSQELADVFPGRPLDHKLFAPLRVAGELIGVLGVGRSEAAPEWSADEMAAVQQVADAFANLLARRRSNDLLRASEARLTAMLASIDDLLVVLDRDGHIRYANSRVEVVTAHAPDALLGRHFLEFVHPDDHHEAIEGFVKTLSGEHDLPITELRLIHADGRAIWFDVDTNGGEDPLVGGYMLSLRDVSARREVQDSAQRQADFEQMVLTLSQWALEVETDDIVPGLQPHLERLARVLGADSAFAALLDGDRVRNVAGWKAEGSRRPSSSFPAEDLAVPAIVARYRTLEPLVVADITEHDEPWADEWRSFPAPDRAGLNVPLVSGGRCLGNVGVAMADEPRTWLPDEVALVKRVSETVAVMLARDRAEASLRASEARLASLLDGSQDLVVVVAADGTITYANGAVERVLGYGREGLIGADIATFVHRGDLQLAARRLSMLLAEEPTPTTTLRLVRADGSVGWWEITGGTLIDPVAGGRVLTCREVTERLANEIAAGARIAHLRYAFDVAQSALDLGAHEFLARLPKVCGEIASMLEADMAYVDQLDRSAGRLTNIASCASGPATPAIGVGDGVELADVAAYVELLSGPEPVVESDLRACDERWAREKRVHLGGERSLMAVGMAAAGELFGVLGVSMCDTPRQWTEDEVTFLRVVGETIAHVLERARLDDALRSSEARFRLLSETAADVVVLVDAGGAITYVSPSSFALLGFTPEELVGRSARSMIHQDHVGSLLPILGEPGGTTSFTSETQLLRADGTTVWVAASTSVVYDAESGSPLELRSSLRDITDRKRLEMQLEQQALHDPLTGLANRALLKNSLADATDVARRDQLAVLLVDLDGFKEVNDTFGHAVGDEVLQTVAGRLRELTRSTDTLARTGGDEFVLLCPGVDEDSAVGVGLRIVRAVGAPVFVDGSPMPVTVSLGASVGVAYGAGEGADADRLLLDADRAMYAAKRAGRGCVRVATANALRA